MKRMLRPLTGGIAVICTALCFLALSSCVLPYTKNAEAARTITVHGTGTAVSKTQEAAITFSVVTLEWVAKTATESNALITQRVVQALMAAGVGNADITAHSIDISRQDTREGGRTFAGRYRVKTDITAALRNVKSISDVIEAAVSAGATEMTPLTWNSSDTESLFREARSSAMQDAQNAASLLAAAAGCKIGDVVRIDEAEPSCVFQAGEEVSVKSGVIVTYTLQ